MSGRQLALGKAATWALGLACVWGVIGCERSTRQPQQPDKPKPPGETGMKLSIESAAFAEGQPIPRKHTGDGEDVSPALSWSGVPAGAKELALICDDPDAPRGTWVHWVLAKIPADATGLPEGASSMKTGASPAGMLDGVNSWGKEGYGGPMPPSGTHRYVFKLYALDAELELAGKVDKAALLKAMEGHVLAAGELIGTFKSRR